MMKDPIPMMTRIMMIPYDDSYDDSYSDYDEDDSYDYSYDEEE